MIREPRNKELTRNELYDEYFRRDVMSDKVKGILPDAIQRMEENKKYFEGKKTLEIMIKGTVNFDKDYKKLFTFLDKSYNIEEGENDELVNALRDLDDFKAFMGGEPINYFSEIENEYINYTRVLNAHIFMELN